MPISAPGASGLSRTAIYGVRNRCIAIVLRKRMLSPFSLAPQNPSFHRRSADLAGIWQDGKESNLHKQFWRLLCYLYTTAS